MCGMQQEKSSRFTLYYYILLAIILITDAVLNRDILIIVGEDVSHMHAIKENKRQRNN